MEILKKHGLICAMKGSHSIGKGLNRVEITPMPGQNPREHRGDRGGGIPNVICFSGNRAGMDDEEGLKNVETAIYADSRICGGKESDVCMELLNSKRNHRDYMCDRTAWGAAMVRGSVRSGSGCV
jgi:hydroxypyruvate isomerase